MNGNIFFSLDMFILLHCNGICLQRKEFLILDETIVYESTWLVSSSEDTKIRCLIRTQVKFSMPNVSAYCALYCLFIPVFDMPYIAHFSISLEIEGKKLGR